MSVVSLLGESAVRSLALALAAGLALRLLRVQHARLAKRVWTSVLLLALAMPALVALGIPSVSLLAMWSRPRTVRLSAPGAQAMEDTASLVPAPSARARVLSTPVMTVRVPLPSALQGSLTAAPSAARRFSLWQIGFAAYLTITSLLLLRVAIGLVLALRLWRRAQHFAVSGTDLPVRLSADLRSPATIAHGILLPLEAITWDRATLTATLAHEQEHVREGDFYLQLAATVHHCFFWISPHAWWLRPQLSRLSETICDRAAVASTGDGLSYAQLLLRFAGVERSPAGMVAMAQSAGMRERIEQLIADPFLSGSFRTRRGQSVVLGIAVAAIASVTAVTVHIVQPAAVVLAAPHTPVPPTPAPPPPAELAPVAAAAPLPQAARAPAPSPIVKPSPAVVAKPLSPDFSFAQVTAMAPFPVRPIIQPGLRIEVHPAVRMLVQPNVLADTHVRMRMLPQLNVVSPEDSDSRGYAIYGPDGDRTITMHSWFGDSDTLHSDKAQHPGGAILFKHDGKSWIIDDPALVKQAQQAYARVQELGKQQGDLGAKQGELGARQGELGALQGELGARQGEWGDRQATLADDFHFELPKDFDVTVNQIADGAIQLATEGDSLDKSQRAAIEAEQKEAQARLDKMMAQLKAEAPQREAIAKQMRDQAEQMRKEMAPLEAQMRELGAKQGELGRLQGELGRQQASLGRQQREASREADRQVQSLIDRAVKDGKAHPVQ